MGSYISTDNTVIVTKKITGMNIDKINETNCNDQPIAIDEDIILVTKEENDHIENENEENNNLTRHKKFISRISVFLNQKVKPKFKEFKEKMSRRKYARNVSAIVAQKIAERTENKNTYRVFTINSVKKSNDNFYVQFDMENDIKALFKKYNGKHNILTTDYEIFVRGNPLLSRYQYYRTTKKIINSHETSNHHNLVMKTGFISNLEEYVCDEKYYYLALPIFNDRFYIVCDDWNSFFIYDSNNYKYVKFEPDLNGKYALFDDGTILSLDEKCSHDLNFDIKIHSHLFIEKYLEEFMNEIETQNHMEMQYNYSDKINVDQNKDEEIEKSFQINSDEENEDEKFTESNMLDDYVEISKSHR